MSEMRFGEAFITDTMDKVHRTKKGFDCCGGEVSILDRIDNGDSISFFHECECGNQITITYKKREGVLYW